jgi:hypothetical protein
MGVPRKFFSRVLAACNGLVTLDSWDPVGITFHEELLPERKILRVGRRLHISQATRAQLLRDSDSVCGVCTKRKRVPDGFEIHHLIPLALLGADSPANWVVACHDCNSTIWQGLDRTGLQLYRTERVQGSLGIRFRRGAFWPVINGRLRLDPV